jgi:MFS transporter, ACS family, hexuronate transporter
VLLRRWSMAVLITAAIAISYFDRQRLSVAIKAIRQEIAVSDADYGRLMPAFYLAYALMNANFAFR